MASHSSDVPGLNFGILPSSMLAEWQPSIREAVVQNPVVMLFGEDARTGRTSIEHFTDLFE
jgi:hypothetical protein